MDESGDLGKGPGSTCEFVLAASVVDDLRQFHSIAKKVRRRFHERHSIKGELKHHRSDEDASVFILKAIAECDVDIYWTSYRKNARCDLTSVDVYIELLIGLLRPIIDEANGTDVQILVDRFSKGSEITSRFISNVKRDIERDDRRPYVLELSCIDSLREPALQVHDFVAGSVFRMVERDDRSHYAIIEEKVVDGRAYNRKWVR